MVVVSIAITLYSIPYINYKNDIALHYGEFSWFMKVESTADINRNGYLYFELICAQLGLIYIYIYILDNVSKENKTYFYFVSCMQSIYEHDGFNQSAR